MTNLLPPKAKNVARKEYIMRTIIVFMLSATVLFLVLSVLFASVQVLVQLRIQSLKTDIVDATQYAETIEEAVTTIDKANEKTKYLVKTEVEDSLLSYVKALEDLSDGVVDIQSYTIQRDLESQVNTVDITAVAAARQNLITFLDKVQAHDRFGRVEVPIGDLSQSEDINFSVSIPVVAK